MAPACAELSLDGPFHYQLPLPLYQSWQQLWPISSSSVKEQLATLVAQQDFQPEPEVRLFCPIQGNLKKFQNSDFFDDCASDCAINTFILPFETLTADGRPSKLLTTAYVYGGHECLNKTPRAG